MLSLDNIADKENVVDSLVKSVRTSFANGGTREANIEITKHIEEIKTLNKSDWVRFKAEISTFHSLSEKDLMDLKSKTIKKSRTGWEVALDVTPTGEVKSNLKNCNLLLSEHEYLKGIIKYNEFLQRSVLTGNVPFLGNIKIDKWGWMEICGDVIAQLRSWLSEFYIDFSKDILNDAIRNTSLKDRFNPLVDLLNDCESEWDGVGRVDSWLFSLCNAKVEQETAEYVSVVGAKWLISAVARAFDPGCKVDTMLILEGGQGIGKSMFLRELSFGYFLELLSDISKGKDVIDKLLGKWIVEMPELKALSGDREANKGFLTIQADQERLSYDARSKPFLRRCVFVGTTNEKQFLKDDSGERRYWPVEVEKCDVEKLKLCIRQLWGEAVARYKNGEKWWIQDEKILTTLERIHEKKTQGDDFTIEVEIWMEKTGKTEFTGLEVWLGAFGGEKDQFSKSNQMRVASVLRKINCVRCEKTKTWSKKT